MVHAGESTDNVDLVAWVMVGLQHLPRSEDIPVVSATLIAFHVPCRRAISLYNSYMTASQCCGTTRNGVCDCSHP